MFISAEWKSLFQTKPSAPNFKLRFRKQWEKKQKKVISRKQHIYSLQQKLSKNKAVPEGRANTSLDWLCYICPLGTDRVVWSIFVDSLTLFQIFFSQVLILAEPINPLASTTSCHNSIFFLFFNQCWRPIVLIALMLLIHN